MRNLVKLLFFLIIFFSTNLMAQEKDNRHYTTLKNGMRVLLIKDNNSELIGHSIFYDVGGLKDYHGKAGLAHFLEHLMFNSTKNHVKNDLTKFLDKHGAEYNAATGQELTFYYEFGHKDVLEDVMKFESDRMKNLLLSDEEIKKELEIIKEERRMRTDNVPEELFIERFLGMHYNQNYYGTSLIGSMNDLDNIRNEDLKAFYHQYYNPNNAILVLIGNFEVPKAMELVEKYYGSLENTESKNDYYRDLTPYQIKKTEKKYFYYNDEQIKSSNYYYLTSAPTIRNIDKTKAITIEFLAYLIENGKNMLKQQLIEEKKIASSISVHYDLFAHDFAPLMIKIEAINDEVIPEIDQFMKEFFIKNKNIIEESEVTRSRNKFLINHIYSLDSLQTKSMLYGQSLLAKMGPEFIDNFEANLKNVDAKKISELWNEIFIENGYSVGITKVKL